MKYTTTPCSFLQGSSARKRRYSSTAVGFPIRNDQKAHSQRVSEDFPSWVGARCAHTYVQGRENCAHWHSERLNKSITGAYIRLAFDVFTPNERPQICPRKPAQRPTKHHSATHHPPTKHHLATHEAPLSDSQSTHEAPLSDPRSTTQRLTTSARCPTKQPTFNPRRYPGSLTVCLRFTWESLGAVQYSSSTSSPYIPGKITDISWFIHNSLIVRLNATINHPSACPHRM